MSTTVKSMDSMMIEAKHRQASLANLTQDEVDAALRQYCAHELTTSDLEDLGFNGLPDIVGHLNRLGLKMPNKPVELETPEVATLRRRGVARLRDSIRAQGITQQVLAGGAKR